MNLLIRPIVKTLFEENALEDFSSLENGRNAVDLQQVVVRSALGMETFISCSQVVIDNCLLMYR